VVQANPFGQLRHKSVADEKTIQLRRETLEACPDLKYSIETLVAAKDNTLLLYLRNDGPNYVRTVRQHRMLAVRD
jgi:hypothetical protein